VKIHHLSCATLCPPLGRALINEAGSMVAHCLLIEHAGGLLLVDTGLGVAEQEDPRATLGRRFTFLMGLRREPHLAAVRQVERLGFDPGDVRDIVVTHLDLDHAGGIPDFPGARVHVHQAERDAARARATFIERDRYRAYQWQHATMVCHGGAADEGDDWFGFRAVRPLPGIDLALVPLFGHTRGHCGVAVRDGQGWLLHCGDAYFHTREMDPDRPGCTPGLRAFQRIIAVDNGARLANQARLRDLARDHASEVRLFCAHDPKEYAMFAAPAPVRLFA
jgi:glyoxylase-like metal-dependent hydrolase (beta-lactamase superfamily II)